MERVSRGDEDAFAALYDVIAGPVHGIVVKVLRDRAQSEEVTQEVLIEVWRQAPRYRPDKGTVMTWVLTIAHRRAVDRVRSARAATATSTKTPRKRPCTAARCSGSGKTQLLTGSLR
ncbi:sigma factor, partial [Streptomyces sp. NPDC048551]|uniref:sigma factor n=1 Tax=Streptomyces sp. NPDC048551 TaxID=3155758 RepID=UPI0034228BA8